MCRFRLLLLLTSDDNRRSSVEKIFLSHFLMEFISYLVTDASTSSR